MRVGIMLRSLDEQGGIGVYSRYLTQELLACDPDNAYILFYRSQSNLGRFQNYPNAKELVVSAPNKMLWDQVSIPLACRQEKVDVLLHPKFTVPLLAPCKTVMVLHGAGWFMPEFSKFWNKTDLKYVRLMMPVYIKKAAAVMSVSEITTETFNRVFNLTDGKIKTVYFGPGKHFRRIEDENILENVRRKYNLPDDFIFTLSGYDRGDRKNFKGILKAYKKHHGRTGHHLVVGGKDCDRFKIDYEIPDDGYGKDILFPGWIEQEDLPAFYSMASVFLYPSNVEAFPIPITEAMACGTPIITSNANGLVEIVGDAAILVDPNDPAEIAEALNRVLCDPGLSSAQSARALKRSENFTWEKCARQTLEILESVVSQR